MLQKIGPHFLWISGRTVNFVDGHDHRHIGRLCMRNRLNRLGHHSVICCNNQDDNICDLCPTRAHRRKGRVARRVEKGQKIAVLLNLISADMLSNTAGFTRDNPRIADRIQKRSLTVVNMAHHRDDRSAWLEIFRAINHLVNHIFNIRIRNAHNFVAKFFHDQLSCILVNGLVLCHHHAHLHQGFHNISNPLGHAVGQLLYHDRVRHLHIADNLLALNSPAHRFLTGALLLTFHGCHGPMPTIISGTGLINSQLARAAIVFPAFVTAWTRRFLTAHRLRDFATHNAAFCSPLFGCWRRCSRKQCCGLCFTLFLCFGRDFCLRPLFAFTQFALFCFLFFAAAIAFSLPLKFVLSAPFCIFCLARFRSLHSF